MKGLKVICAKEQIAMEDCGLFEEREWWLCSPGKSNAKGGFIPAGPFSRRGKSSASAPCPA
jgi:hypothetical protein